MIENAIEVENLSHLYESRRALQDVSFSLGKGEFVAIVGPNGSGKSTLLKCVCRLLKGWRGDVRIDGRNSAKMSQREIAKAIGYVPQAAKASLPFSVWDFAMMGRYAHLGALETIRAEDKTAVENALESVGVQNLAKRRMNALSGGERQAVLVAAAMAQGAKTLLLDEPGSFLDCKRTNDLNALLRKMNKGLGLSILCVTHDINQALSLSDKVLALKEGSASFFGTPAEALASEVPEKLYGVRFERLERGKGRLPWLVAEEEQQ